MGNRFHKPASGSTASTGASRQQQKQQANSKPRPASPPVRSKDIFRIGILLVDPQKGFHEGGSLAVAGANADAARVASLIRAKFRDITDMYITLDSHHRNHIAHGIAWINSCGASPTAFTLISADDAAKEVWKAADPERVQTFKDYAKDLEAKGRFKVCILPEHSLIGTDGHAVEDQINSAAQEWAGRTRRSIHYVWKGQNLNTEMYSAMQAEVPVASDPATEFNTALMEDLNSCDKLIICGQALSHCVNFTTRDIVSRWAGNKADLILLTDCSSAVGGFESSAEEFVEFCKSSGMTVTNSVTLLEKWSQIVRPEPPVNNINQETFVILDHSDASNICSRLEGQAN
jgi:nicotinamidase/pyrazinamidase